MAFEKTETMRSVSNNFFVLWPMFACVHYPPALITLRYATGEQIHSYYFQLTACLLDRFKNFQLTLANR